MRKLLILLAFGLFAMLGKASAQAITDTASLRTYINTHIVTNSSGGITAAKMNNVLNGIANLMKAYAVDTSWWIAPDTLVLGRRGGFTQYKIRIAISPAGSESDPTVSTAAKSISAGDISNWNSKQPAITNSSTVSIIANVVSAANTTALWNANQLQGRALSSTAPTTNQVIGWNGSQWVPMDQTGAGGITNLDTARSASTVTIQPSGGGSVAIIKAVDIGSNKAGVITPSMKRSLDSAWTKTSMLNDSVRVWYNSLGVIVHRDTLFSFSFVKSLEPLSTWGAQLKNDQETPGANKVYGTDGSGVKGWKADPAGGGLSGLTTNRLLLATSSTTAGDDAGLTYNPTTNKLTTDSINNIKSNIDSIYSKVTMPYTADTIYYFCDSYGNAVGATNSIYGFTTLLSSQLGLVTKNFSVSGATLEKRTPVDPYGTVNMIDRLGNIPVKNSKAKYILFGMGLNDIGYNNANYIPANFSTDYRRVLDTTIARGWSPSDIILVTPWYIGVDGRNSYASTTSTTASTEARHLQFVDTVIALAAQYGTKIVDQYRATQSNDSTQLVSTDVIHPNNPGHAFLAQNIFNKIGYTVKSNGQNLAVNGKSELQSVYIPTTDTLPNFYNLRAVGLTPDNKLAGFRIGALIRNNTNTQPDNGRIWLSGKILQGATVTTSHVESIITDGGIKGAYLRANGNLPGGMTGNAVEAAMVGSVGYVGAYNRTGSAGLSLALNGLGGQVIVGGFSPSGSHALFINGTAAATEPSSGDSSTTLVSSGWVKRQGYGVGGGGGAAYIPTSFSGAVNVSQSSNLLTFDYGVQSASYRATGASSFSTGAGMEMAYTGNIGYIYAYDRTGAAPKNISMQFLGGSVAIGANTFSGSNPLQVTGTASATKIRAGNFSAATYTLENAGTDGTLIGGGTTAQRIAGLVGAMRWNSDSARIEVFDGTIWRALLYNGEASGTGITGGSSNVIPRYTSTTTLGTSGLSDDGTTVTSSRQTSVTGAWFSTAGAIGSTAIQTISTGTATTISNNIQYVFVDPASVLASHGITMPPSPISGQIMDIIFGGNIAAGNAVVTALTISPNSGQTIYGSIPTTANGGDVIRLVFSSSKWYRVRL